ncbi:MAG: hypothetical protein ISR65_04960 [Bacteriovoracaceae bacterium]|nr:hypothetical protein [Bacteriovoracaceae bacterium]
MSRTILCIGDTALENLYAVNLKMYVGTDVIEQTSGKSTTGLLEYLEAAHLIIAEEKIGEENTSKVILEYLKANNRMIPMVVIGDDESTDEYVTRLPSDADLKTIIRAAAKCLGVTATVMAKQVVPDYIFFPLQYFQPSNVCICDIFHKKEDSSDNEQAYTRFFTANQKIEKEKIDNLRKDGVKGLFIPAKNRLTFVNEFTTNVLSTLKDKNASKTDKMAATDCAMHMIAEKIKGSGIDEESIQLAKVSIETMSELAEDRKNDGIAKLLKQLLDNPTSFNYAHCQLISHIACHIIKQMNWGSQEQQEKIVFITFFHDILLKTDELCTFHSEDELLMSSIGNDDRELVISHATQTAQLIRGYPRAPIGADSIIEQHHGSRNGHGFPSAISPLNLSPLAIVFIITESYVHYLLKLSPTNEFDHNNVIGYITETFPKAGKIRSTIEHLSKLKF